MLQKSLLLQIILIILLFSSCKKNTISQPKSVDHQTVDSKPICGSKGLFVGLIEGDSVMLSYVLDDSIADKMRVFLGTKTIFQDTSESYDMHSDNEIRLVSQSKHGTNFILLPIFEPIEGNRWQILLIREGQLKQIQTVVMGLYTDIDNDSYLEIGGMNFVEAACINCDSGFYEPIELFELSSYIRYESQLSRKYTMQKYNGVYLGRESLDTVLYRNPNFDYKIFGM
jgi:hypothetical protein